MENNKKVETIETYSRLLNSLNEVHKFLEQEFSETISSQEMITLSTDVTDSVTRMRIVVRGKIL